MAADSPEFGQFSEKSPCGHVADARNGFQERLGFAPSWGMLDGVADVVVDRVELLLEIVDVRRASPRARGLSRAWRPRLVSMPIISMIWPPTDEFGEVDPPQVPEEAVLVDASRSAKRAITSARRACRSLAKRPIARAKSRIWRGLTTQSGSSNAGRQGRRNSGFEAASRL